MVNEKLFVPGQLDVQFDHVDADPEGLLEGSSGVLRASAGGTAMGDSKPGTRVHLTSVARTDAQRNRFVARLRPACHSPRMSPSWWELKVSVPTAHAELAANFLIESGSPGVILEETGENTTVAAHFEDSPDVEILRNYLEALGLGRCESSLSRIRDEGWADNWRQHFPPVDIGARLSVRPPWNAEPAPGRLAVVIEPGMAFGTGHHATTIGCLTEIDRLLDGSRGDAALDLGTGSGILAIAMAKLGAERVLAIDIDPVACEVARSNVRANGVGDVVEIGLAMPEPAQRFDLIVANLFTNLLLEMGTRIRALLEPSGILVTSGFLAVDAPRLKESWRELGLQIEHETEAEGWVTLTLRSPGASD